MAGESNIQAAACLTECGDDFRCRNFQGPVKVGPWELGSTRFVPSLKRLPDLRQELVGLEVVG